MGTRYTAANPYIRTGGAVTQNITAGLASVLATKTIYVDGTNGTSGGASGHIESPFKTLAQAKAAASSGDTIIVYPGTYDERNLLKNGVNWYFHPGANITYTGAQIGAIFDTGSTGTNAATTSKITGYGIFTHIGSGQATLEDTERSACLFTGNTADNITFEGISAGVAPTVDDPGNRMAIRAMTGTVRLRFSRYFGGGIWWSDGDCYVNGEEVIFDGDGNSGAYGIWSTPGTAQSAISDTYTSGSLWINVSRIYSTGSATVVISCEGTSSARVWFNGVSEINGNAGATQPILIVSGSKVYLNTISKITIGSTSGFHIIQSGGEIWGTIHKLGTSGTGTGGGLKLSGGSFRGDILHFDDTAGGGNLIQCSGGTHRVKIGDATMSATGTGITHSGGTLTVEGGLIDTSANNATNPAIATDNGLTIRGSHLVAQGARGAITGTAGKTVTTNATGNNAASTVTIAHLTAL